MCAARPRAGSAAAPRGCSARALPLRADHADREHPAQRRLVARGEVEAQAPGAGDLPRVGHVVAHVAQDSAHAANGPALAGQEVVRAAAAWAGAWARAAAGRVVAAGSRAVARSSGARPRRAPRQTSPEPARRARLRLHARRCARPSSAPPDSPGGRRATCSPPASPARAAATEPARAARRTAARPGRACIGRARDRAAARRDRRGDDRPPLPPRTARAPRGRAHADGPATPARRRRARATPRTRRPAPAPRA